MGLRDIVPAVVDSHWPFPRTRSSRTSTSPPFGRGRKCPTGSKEARTWTAFSPSSSPRASKTSGSSTASSRIRSSPSYPSYPHFGTCLKAAFRAAAAPSAPPTVGRPAPSSRGSAAVCAAPKTWMAKGTTERAFTTRLDTPAERGWRGDPRTVIDRAYAGRDDAARCILVLSYADSLRGGPSTVYR